MSQGLNSMMHPVLGINETTSEVLLWGIILMHGFFNIYN